jgi:hypothetical protein
MEDNTFKLADKQSIWVLLDNGKLMKVTLNFAGWDITYEGSEPISITKSKT